MSRDVMGAPVRKRLLRARSTPTPRRRRRQRFRAVRPRLGGLQGPLVPAPLIAKPSCAGPIAPGSRLVRSAAPQHTSTRSLRTSEFPAATVSRILKRPGPSIGFHSAIEPGRADPSLKLRAAPGEIIHIDIKKARQVQSEPPTVSPVTANKTGKQLPRGNRLGVWLRSSIFELETYTPKTP